MLRVAICDDSALERDILADFLSHYCNSHAIDYSYKMYDSGEPLYIMSLGTADGLILFCWIF